MGVCKQWNGLLEWWNSGTEFSRVNYQILHPNKVQIPKRQLIYTFYRSYIYTTAMYLVKSVSTQYQFTYRCNIGNIEPTLLNVKSN